MDAIRLLSAVWGKHSQGWVSVPALRGEKWYERWFEWPDDAKQIAKWIAQANRSANVYFSPLVYRKPSRLTARECSTLWAWADFDEVDPESLDPKPTVLWESSPGKYQGLYLLKERVSGDKIEETNKRIAYATAADPSGWDAGQVLRVPGSRNHKYDGSPKGRILRADRNIRFSLDDLSRYSLPPGHGVATVQVLEQSDELSFQETLNEWRPVLSSKLIRLLETPPDEVEKGRRSDRLWTIIRELVDAGLSDRVVYTLAKGCAWNKFKGRRDEEERIRKEIQKAKAQQTSHAPEGMPEIVETEREQKLDQDEAYLELPEHNWLAQYVKASRRYCIGAPYIYHVACGLTLLSIACGRLIRAVDVEADLNPILWVLLVAPSRSGKSRTRRFARKVFEASGLSDQIPVFTSFSPEGIVKHLGESPQEQAWLLPDEAGRLFKSIHRRDYMAEARELLNELYDGDYQRRVTMKDTKPLNNPTLNFFGTTQPEGFLDSVRTTDIGTGFLARFFVVYRNEVPSPTRRRLPPGYDDAVLELGRGLAEIRKMLTTPQPALDIVRKRQRICTVRPEGVEVDFSAAAFRRLVSMSKRQRRKMQEYGDAAPLLADVESKALRLAMLLAVANRPDIYAGGIEVDDEIMEQAISLVEKETDIAVELVRQVGGTDEERAIDLIVSFLASRPGRTATRTEVSRRFGKLIGLAYRMDQIEKTMIDRGLIEVTLEKRGKRSKKPTKVYTLKRLRRIEI